MNNKRYLYQNLPKHKEFRNAVKGILLSQFLILKKVIQATKQVQSVIIQELITTFKEFQLIFQFSQSFHDDIFQIIKDLEPPL